MRWDLIIALGVPTLLLSLAAWYEHKAKQQRPSGWFEENDCDHVIEDFRWLPEGVRKAGGKI